MSFYNPYRWCVALNCKNSTLKTPEKLFIKVPNDVSMRYVWLEHGGRDPSKYSAKSHLYLCEDHFNLEQDMENYIQYKMTGKVKKIRMKPNTIPSMFDHLSIVNHILEAESTTSSLQPGSSTSCLEEESISYMEQTVEVLPSTSFQTEFVNASQPAESTLTAVDPALSTSHVMEKDISTAYKADKEIQVQIMPVMGYKAVQANLSAHHRSRATQINYRVRHSTTSLMKSSSSVVTSPLFKNHILWLILI